MAPKATLTVLPLVSDPVHGVVPEGPPAMDHAMLNEVSLLFPSLQSVSVGLMIALHRLPIASLSWMACAFRLS